MKTIISVNKIFHKINNKLILNDINLDINLGDVFALIGKNGAGKTTLFEIILKDIKPSNGCVEYDNDVGFEFSNTGVVYDNTPMFPLLKVKEVVDYFSSIYGVKFSEIPTRYFDVFGLNGILNSFMSVLSQGEKKKVALFLSIINNPKVLILDEPFSNIDPTVIESIWKVLKENNRTILFTSHNWYEIEHIATKITFISKGNIILPPTSPQEIIKSLPHSKKVIVDYNEDLMKKLKNFEYYINENLIHIFYDGNSELVDEILKYSKNFSFKDCDIKDAYLLKTNDNE
jgi:ABC-2 type transport system ATP-binding protein